MHQPLVPAAEFTVRDLNRRPAAVLAACDRLAVVRVRRRDGRVYEIRPQAPPASAKPAADSYPDFAARRRALGMPGMTKSQRARFEKLIAGE